MIIRKKKHFFQPGDIVKMKQDIPNKPIMVVYRIERTIMRNTMEEIILKGCRCRWFTKDGHLQEAIFSTKDLVLI